MCTTDVHNLGIRCRVNGIIKQNSNTNQLVHRSEAIIAHISRYKTYNLELYSQALIFVVRYLYLLSSHDSNNLKYNCIYV